MTDGFSQGPAEDMPDLQRFTDELVGFQEADADYETLYENLVQILSSPYDLNNVSPEELRLLHILSDRQIDNLMAYRREHGKLLDIYELQIIPEFDLDVLSRLRPFIKVRDPSNSVDQSLLQRIFSRDHSYLITRYEHTLETKKGFQKTPGSGPSFTGSPHKLYYRLRSVAAGDFSFGITGEKDAGERTILNPARHQWGFDFNSYHLQLQNKGRLKNIILGDFQTQFGQGLILGGAFGLGKGGESVSTTRKSNAGFLPYTSINEGAYHRGAAITLKPFRSVGISAFYSRTRRDAAPSQESDGQVVTSFQTTGYHRTAIELANRKKVNEQGCGLVVHLQKNKLDAGFIMHALYFDVPVKRRPNLYNQRTFEGSQSINTGLFLNYNIRNISFFSEVAQSIHGGRGGLAGVLISAHPSFDLAILYRNYMRNFHTFNSNAFSENTHPQNERGVYWGWKYRWNRRYNVTGYVDMFAFPWLGFRRYTPSQGYEWLLRGNYQPSRNVSLFVQVREERKSRNLSGLTALYQAGEAIKRNAVAHCDYGVGETVRFKTRMQYNEIYFDQKTTRGFTLLQDVSFSAGRFKFTGRHALFETDHHDNRHYVYEHDAWLAYSLPAYSGIGVRNYALIEYKVHKRLTIWGRYARTRLISGEEIGSGVDAIAGNTKNDVKFQARLKF